MTWPFENDTSAVVKKLANRSIKADKRSKAFLFLTIALAVCMVFSILLISIGTQEEYKNTQRNKAQIGILGITDEQAGLLHQNTDVSWIGEYSAIGLFYQDNKTITVADTGIGIPLSSQPRVFERFYRVDKSHSKEIGGTGLGLSIVKHAAIYHGAKIDLESVENVGTKIKISF